MSYFSGFIAISYPRKCPCPPIPEFEIGSSQYSHLYACHIYIYPDFKDQGGLAGTLSTGNYDKTLAV